MNTGTLAAGLERIAIAVIDVVLEQVGVEGLRALLIGHPVAATIVIQSERAAAGAVIDELEDAKFGPKT